jgi:hypothetical protein
MVSVCVRVNAVCAVNDVCAVRQATHGAEKAQAQMIQSNACFACKRVFRGKHDLTPCQCYDTTWPWRMPCSESLRLCRTCVVDHKLGSTTCDACEKLYCHGCGLHSNGCKRVKCDKCTGKEKSWLECSCRGIGVCPGCACTELDPFRPSDTAHCSVCNIVLGYECCDYEECAACEKITCRLHLTDLPRQNDSNVPGDRAGRDEDSDSQPQACTRCVDEIEERGRHCS